MTTIQQHIEQVIIDNPEVASGVITEAFEQYIEEFLATPTVGQLNWFLLESKGLRVDEDTIQSVMDNELFSS